VSIEALLSRSDGTDETIDLGRWQSRQIARDELLWIDAQSPDAEEVAIIRRAVGLGDRASESLGIARDRPTATVFDGAVEVVVLALPDDDDDEPVALHIILGDEWVVTRHADPLPFLDDHRERIRDQRDVGQLTPVQFLVSVLDWHIDRFLHAAEELEREVEELDDAALRREEDLLSSLVRMRRRIARVRRILGMHREVFAEMIRPDFIADMEKGDARALEHVNGRLERAIQALAQVREMLMGTFDIHMTRTAQRTNDIMRVLTLASVVLLPSVVLAGIMGMNFKVGLFDEPNLFWLVVAAMVAMAVGALGVARWRGWL
jgi:magnesium transporter